MEFRIVTNVFAILFIASLSGDGFALRLRPIRERSNTHYSLLSQIQAVSIQEIGICVRAAGIEFVAEKLRFDRDSVAWSEEVMLLLGSALSLHRQRNKGNHLCIRRVMAKLYF